MKTLFIHTGYRLFTEQEKECQKKISFSYILNPDGSVRWFWNSNSKKPLFLKFYNAGTFKAKLFSTLVKIVFGFGLQKLCFKKETVYYIKGEEPLFDIEGDWAIFTGTVGPNNKALLFANGFFYKIAETENAKNLIKKEFINSKYARNSNQYIAPKVFLHNDHVLQIKDISEEGRRKSKFGLVHAKALQGIKEKYQGNCRVLDWAHFQHLKEESKNTNDTRVSLSLLKKISVVLSNIDVNENVALSFSHGDFTPWNCFAKKNMLAVYDWELARFDRSKGFDFFHFIIQNGVLIERKPWKEIYEEIKAKNAIAFQFNNRDLEKYLKFYLLINTLSYLKIYSAQEKWHTQVHWLLQTWSEALNIFLTENYTERQLLIMDVFDWLAQTKYATLKFIEEEPEKLNLNSDIDLVISSQDSEKLIHYLSLHSLVRNVYVVRKSFMKSVRVVTWQNQILNLDLIFQFKWKHLQIMSVGKILKRRIQNTFGVYKVSERDTARFIDLFYTLNRFDIPEKYQSFVSEKLKSWKISDRKTELKVIKIEKVNRGFSFVKNTFNYIKDSFAEKGFVVTFSGVDGAGKSTVISEVSELIEKRYRRPVKVLRHRPSLLPILSVWTKGKEKAHQDAVNSLPRQGTNKSGFSSLLRFAYYYTDYILGQFIIYLKYVSRGKIVLYDRYYFDFIADAKRSNIKLPKSVTETGYHLLLKPKFNFFLYAEPEKILSRKKELSYHSICELTKEYNQLFTKLDKQNQKSKYLAIENNDLDTTLGTIMNTIITAK